MGLEASQAEQLIGANVLWQGQTMTLLGLNGTQAEIAPLNALSSSDSRFVSINDLDPARASTLVCQSDDAFTSPSVFRSQSISKPIAHDTDLDRSFDPTDPNNLDEILRQLASDDPTQRQAGYVAFQAAQADAHRRGPAAEAEFQRRVDEARQRIALEHPEEAPRVEETYQDYRSGNYQAPAPVQTSNGGANGGTGSGGSPNGSVVVSGGSIVSGSGMVAADGAPIVGGAGGVMAAGFMPGLAGGVADSVLLTAASVLPSALFESGSLPHDLPVGGARRDDRIDAAAVPVPVPVNFYDPVTVTIQSDEIPTAAGKALVEGLAGDFFTTRIQGVSGGLLREPSPIVNFLTHDTPETHPYIERVNQAAAGLLNTYWTQPRIGAWSFETAHQPITLSYRYDQASRGIVVSIVPPGSRADARRDSIFGDSDDDRPESPFARFPRFTGRSLALSPIGVGPGRETNALESLPILIPFAIYAGVRVATDVRVAASLRPSGAATDQAPSRISQRGNYSDQRGGSRDGRSRGGQGGQQQQDQPDEEVLADTVAA